MLSYTDLKPGTIFKKDGQPWQVLEFSFMKKQMAKGVVQVRIKNLISAKVIEMSARQNEDFEEAEIEIAPAIFIYASRGEYWFHEPNDPKARFSLKEEIVGDNKNYLKPNLEIKVFKFEDEIISLQVPIKMEFKVTEAAPAVKGNTSQGAVKTVTLETGYKINVPLFIKEGDVIRINTETGEYTERASI